jgi:hypothetical protein
MTANPLGAALAAIEPDDTGAFKAALKARLLDELREQTVDQDGISGGPASLNGVTDRPGLAFTDELTLEPAQSALRFRRKQWPILAAAAFLLAAGLATTMLVRHRSVTISTAPSASTATSLKPLSANTANAAKDLAIANAAILDPGRIDTSWTAATLPLQPPTTSDMGVAECETFRGKPALDPAYDATTAQALFSKTGRSNIFEIVRVMPTSAVATEYMDSISDSAFPDCYAHLINASMPGQQTKTAILHLPQLAVQPGDRALLIATDTRFANGSASKLNVWVQVDRVVVQVNPSPDLYEPDDPLSETQKVINVAVAAAKTALQAHP